MSETSKLFGHKTLFSNLIYLDQIEKFPNKILLNGPKGIGKKLLVSHLLNYLYSQNNEQFYNLKNNEYKINNNLSLLLSSITSSAVEAPAPSSMILCSNASMNIFFLLFFIQINYKSYKSNQKHLASKST